MASLTVEMFLAEKAEDLQLILTAGKSGIAREIKLSEINRPGLTFTGYVEHFQNERIQIIGRGEYAYLKSLTPERCREVFEQIFSYPNIPCCLLMRGLEPLPIMVEFHERHNVPLIVTQLPTSRLTAELISYLEYKLSPSITMHGVLVNVYGLGVLLLGDAGVGKSECALELIKRNHMLVADDVVRICQYAGGRLIGRREDIIEHHMELRGVGIINVQSMFGIGFILDESPVELIIKLTEDEIESCDRTGLDETTMAILDIKLPQITIPVRPGRNLAILIEIAALNQRLKKRGYHSAREFNQRLIERMAPQSPKKGPHEKK